MKLRVVGLCSVAAVLLAGQELTPRQLFYQDEAPAKAAPKAVPKAATKKAPAKTAKTESPKPAPLVSSPETPAQPANAEPPRVINASYTTNERPLGLRYALVQVTAGAEREVSPDATFRSGDQVRVKVEGNRDGYLYVIARGSSGVWKPLFPAPNINGGDNRIATRRAQRLPSDTQAFEFDEHAGQEQLFVIFSAEPVKDIDELIPSLAGPAPEKKELRPGAMIVASAAPINDAFVSRLRNTYSRDLIVQTVTPSQPAQSPSEATVPESAVYVVSKSGGRVIADIKLEHK